MTETPAVQTSRIPRDGVIVGGMLDGWRYTFLRLIDNRPTMQVFMDVTVTQPNWPFPSPKPVHLTWGKDFDSLAPTPTESKLVRDQPVWLDFNELTAEAVQQALENDPDPAVRKLAAKTKSPTENM